MLVNNTTAKSDRFMLAKATTAIQIEPRECFMLGTKAFLENKVRATEMQMLVYMTLISRRDYLQYKLYKTTTLPTYFAYDFNLDKLQRNRLINITNGNIYFKYE